MQDKMRDPSVTIVVSVADRFSCTLETIERILQYTEYPFELIFVDGNSPKYIQKYLNEKTTKSNLKVIRSEKYLSPSQSRNMGANIAESEYILLIENDVFVSDGWLRALIRCAQETNADVVTPLVCIGEPLAETIHLAGGETHIKVQNSSAENKKARQLYKKHYFSNRSLEKVKGELNRKKCSLADLHCILVKRNSFELINGFDELLLSTRDHMDFCLRMTEKNFSIYFEPSSVVTYLPVESLSNLKWSDLPYFFLRWSNAWEKKSLNRFIEKWNLSEDNYFRMRFKNLGQYRQNILLKPIIVKLRKYRIPMIGKLLLKIEKLLHNYFYNYEKIF